MKACSTLLAVFLFLAAGCSNVRDSSMPRLSKDNVATKSYYDRVKTANSSHDFNETVARVQAAIKKRPLNLFATIDHAAGAAKAGLSLPPSTLFIFGNPKGGTPLMTRNPQMGIVLPLKMHVYQEGNVVKVSYTNIAAEAQAYGLDSAQLPVPVIAKMLDGLAAEVADDIAGDNE